MHADGKIIGTALWEIREALGKEMTDGMAFRAVQSSSGATGLDELGELILAEAESLGPEAQAVVEPILIDHGVLGCQRAKPWVAVRFEDTDEQVPHQVEGTQGAAGFPDGVPGYHQWFVDVPAGKVVRLGWSFVASSGFGATEPSALSLAVKKGEMVSVGPTGAVSGDALIDSAPLANNAQAVALAGACVPAEGGRLYLLFVNPSENASSVATMSVELIDAPGVDDVVAACD